VKQDIELLLLRPFYVYLICGNSYLCILAGFLNVGDDEIIDDDDDFQASAEGTHLENSGWSSRTRFVSARV